MGGLRGGEGGDRSGRRAEGGEGETQRLQRVGGDPRGRSRQRTSWVPGPSVMCQSAGGERGREPPGTGRGDWNREAGGPSTPNPSTATHFLSGQSCALILLIINLPPTLRSNSAHPSGPHPSMSFPHPPDSRTTAWGFFFLCFFFFLNKSKLYLPTPAGGLVIF